MTQIKRLPMPSVDEDMEQLELSIKAAGGINWFNHLGKLWHYLLECTHTLWSGNSTPGYIPNVNVYMYILRHMCKNIQSNIACNIKIIDTCNVNQSQNNYIEWK